MNILAIIKIILALATIATGFLSLIKPASTTGFTGLTPNGPRGISEIRAVLGGLFIAVGLAPFILNNISAYIMLGIMYLGIAIVRAFSIVFDKSMEPSNFISLAVEIVFGVVLVL